MNSLYRKFVYNVKGVVLESMEASETKLRGLATQAKRLALDIEKGVVVSGE